jgi:hypothetical protein
MLQNNALFGIPLPLVGFGCFILALLFWNVWPKSKAKPYKRISWPGYILHFFHPLAWVLLGLAAFVQVRNPEISIALAGLGGFAYIIFIVMLAKA